MRRQGGLTPRQRQILDYLVSAIQDKGYAPSVREIATFSKNRFGRPS